MSDGEILALALGRAHGSVTRSHEMLERFGGLSGMSEKTVTELQNVLNVGEATASKIAAMVELSRRLSRVESSWTNMLRQPSDVASFLRAHLRGSAQENFVVIGLDSRQRVRLVRTVGVGSLAQVDVHPREVFRPLIRNGIHAVILAHNHPSGDSEPSEADVELTNRMCEIGKMVGIPVLDHLVVTDSDFCSLGALGFIPAP